ncbi:MAG: quinoprotein dehydrogenase-associated putative ABC transporter substrate-binding protein [Methylotenera sp.]|nr:quinoprotein dehydrogenase-associated putative ABC transporter substrate-binding protein [Methylotenera sp.]OQW70418.1 MAG: ABC transporter substrate-binding protein [Proteobacteria bacterium ST_bin12]
MLKQLKGLAVCLALVSGYAVAAEEPIKDSDVPSLSADEGRPGEVRRVDDGTEFKVCSDPDNMPYSNIRGEGFEDKIAEVLAKDLGKKLSHAYAYNRQGFLRNTINAGRCDVIIGTTSDFDGLRTTTPYYRSGHVFVWRKDSNFNITNWDSPDLRKGVIGIVDKSPATVPLNDFNLMANAKPYRLQRDLNFPPSFLIDDLAKGEIDVAVMWGPIAGYYMKQSKVPMEMAFVPEYNKVNLQGKEYWNISMGVRMKDKQRLAPLNAAIERNKDKIAQILADYGIPTVPVVEGDTVFKK